MRDVLLTVDTEGPRGSDPVRYQIWGDVHGRLCGIPCIIDTCDKYGIKALFFVDIPESYDYGYEKIKEVILFIIEKGHDVGVHIHPHHCPSGQGREFLFEYSREEQKKIISECTEIFKKITGTPPLSFRAGKYGANRDTLDILEELGYAYDFSEFYSQKWCGIKPNVAYVLPQKYGKLIEFPVTVFRSINLSNRYIRYDKLEITSCYSEIRHVLDLYAKDEHEGVIVLFLHSFSFLDFLTHPDSPTFNRYKFFVFERTLRYISQSDDFHCTSEQMLRDFAVGEGDSHQNIVATRGFFRQLWYSFLRVFRIRKTNKKAARLLSTGYFLLIFLCLIAVLLWRFIYVFF